MAGKLLRKEGFAFEVAFTSVLKRAIKTLWIVLEEMDLMWIPVHHSWRLNERHYGALQGLNKAETAAKFGETQVKTWRRAYDIRPPALEDNDPRLERSDPRYADIEPRAFPRTECLRDTVARFLPFGHNLTAIELGQKTYCVRRRRNNEPACVEIDDMDHRTAEQRQLIDDAQRFLLTASRPPRGDGRPERVHCIASRDSIHEGTNSWSIPTRPPTESRRSTV